MLSTLHTNDAASAVTRLVEMGVQPFLLSSSLLGAMAQRLVRQLCRRCRTPFIPTDEDLRSLDLDPKGYGPPRPLVPGQAPPDSVPPPAQLEQVELEEIGPDDELTQVKRAEELVYDAGRSKSDVLPPRPIFYRAAGCDHCVGTGYRGQIGIFELLIVDDLVRREILNNSDAKKITRTAVSRGMISLREDGVRQVMAGRTSIEEVLAATHDADVELE